MARSPLTLAASVTSALPRVGVVNVAALTEHAAGRFDSALVTLDDGRRVVVRVAEGAQAARELAADRRALSALTPGVRGVLPFSAPVVLGETTLDDSPTVVQTWLPGYRVDAAQVPPGEGIATRLGAAIAVVHDLPTSIVRDAGLPVLTASQVRDQAERLLDRCEATGLLPFGLLKRWSAAVASDALWRFETTVIVGGVDPASFLFEDTEGEPVITGLLHWSGLSVGDPAVDLRWLASAPDARIDVLDAYAHATPRAIDSALSERARLHAELEFGSWLVHGHAAGAESVVADAVALLTSLDESVRDAPPLAQESITIDDAIAVLGRVAEESGIHTSLQTDTYDAEALAEYAPDDDSPSPSRSTAITDLETAPLDPAEWQFTGSAPASPSPAPASAGRHPSPVEPQDDALHDPEDSARNALRRWTETA